MEREAAQVLHKKTNSMKTIHCTKFLQTGALVLALGLSACASDNSHVATLGTVGPKPPNVHPQGPLQGYLKVYSATSEHNDGDLMYYPHSRYAIYHNDGTRFEWVENHVTESDESPELVTLPVGNYYVMAHSELDGMVKVPVLIKGGQTTVVNLERGRMSDGDTHGVDASRAVVLPSGQVAGWRTSS